VKSKNIYWKYLIPKIKYIFLRVSYVCPRWIFIFDSGQAQTNSVLDYTAESLSHEKKQRKIVTYEDGTKE
jgi:hypothetical protein